MYTTQIYHDRLRCGWLIVVYLFIMICIRISSVLRKLSFIDGRVSLVFNYGSSFKISPEQKWLHDWQVCTFLIRKLLKKQFRLDYHTPRIVSYGGYFLFLYRNNSVNLYIRLKTEWAADQTKLQANGSISWLAGVSIVLGETDWLTDKMAAVIWCRLLCCSFTEPASQARKERFWWRKLRICCFCCECDLFWALTSHKLRVVLIGEWSVSEILSPVFCFVFYFNNFNTLQSKEL